MTLRSTAFAAGATALLSTTACAVWLQALLGLGAAYPIKSAAAFVIGMTAVLGLVSPLHPFSRFGPANVTTTWRAALVALLIGLIGEPASVGVATTATVLAAMVTALDGVDGWLARRTRLSSAFGARFDVETDALFMMAMSILIWQHGRAGAWVLAGGVLRYAFVAAGWVLPWMAGPLRPTRRARVIAAAHMLGLTGGLAPIVPPAIATAVLATTLAALAYSFAVDIGRLWRAEGTGGRGRRGGTAWRGWTGLVAAIVVLNASLAFTNVWPTLWIWWNLELSLDLAIALVLLVVIRRRRGALSGRALRWMAILWVALMFGRYVDLTTRSLFGRSVNLYWDLRFVPDVGAMFAVVANWLAWLVVIGLVIIPLLAYQVVRWALGRVNEATGDRRVQRGMVAGAVVTALVGVIQIFEAPLPPRLRVAEPALPVYANHARTVTYEITTARSRPLPPSPAIASDLARVHGADVLLVFLESYGAVSWEHPQFARGLAASRRRFTADIRESGRAVVSAMVESTTFGGESWLAHVSLLSGVEVRDQRTNLRIMGETRDTLVKVFGRRGYRTVAVMPGLLRGWPQGRFYGFDDIYDHARLDYHGPTFGWWDINDQFVLAKVDALEIEPRSRPPLFMFLPTITTHAPFTPAPPYQPDWARMLTPQPYDTVDLHRAWSGEADWTNLGPSYVQGMTYAYATFGGYLQLRSGRDLVMILIGDHQPPAMVSGEGANWNVPIHVIASRQDLLDDLVNRGFREGLDPQGPVVARMDRLLTLLLTAFGHAAAQTPVGQQ